MNWYGILITTGVVSALGIAFLEARRRKEDIDHIAILAIFVLIPGIIGARLYHVIDKWDYFVHNPGDIIGGHGLGIFGAIIGGIIGLIVYTKWKKVSTLRWLDILAPGVMLAQAIGRWGNYVNQELFGYPTDLPWGIYIDPANRPAGYESFSHFHPLFLYESLWNLAGFALIMLFGRKLYSRLRDGDMILFYAIWYGAGRFLLEGMKFDVWTLNGIPTARWITGIAIIIAVCLLLFRHRSQFHNSRS